VLERLDCRRNSREIIRHGIITSIHSVPTAFASAALLNKVGAVIRPEKRELAGPN
jgi:hypothetical protein